MLFTDPNQYAVLALLLVVGWLFGFASHTGGRKWKQAYREETARRTERDTRIKALEQDKQALEARNAALTSEVENARVGAAGVTAASAAQPAFDRDATVDTQTRKRGWFDWSRGDDLTRLRGVDGDISRRLKAERVERFAEIANLSDEDEIALERRLDLPAGYIRREQWREQARLLADGHDADWNGRFG